MEQQEKNITRAPFTKEQIKKINQYQQEGRFHPYTCPDCVDEKGRAKKLIANEEGLFCQTCDYKQDWVHSASIKDFLENY
jgi:hypothetical protein